MKTCVTIIYYVIKNISESFTLSFPCGFKGLLVDSRILSIWVHVCYQYLPLLPFGICSVLVSTVKFIHKACKFETSMQTYPGGSHDNISNGIRRTTNSLLWYI